MVTAHRTTRKCNMSSPYLPYCLSFFFFFSSRRRHTRFDCDWSSDVCSSDPGLPELVGNGWHAPVPRGRRARRRVAGHDVVAERAPQPLVASGAELEGAPAEGVVQAGQVLAERRREKPRGAFGRGEPPIRR